MLRTERTASLSVLPSPPSTQISEHFDMFFHGNASPILMSTMATVCSLIFGTVLILGAAFGVTFQSDQQNICGRRGTVIQRHPHMPASRQFHYENYSTRCIPTSKQVGSQRRGSVSAAEAHKSKTLPLAPPPPPPATEQFAFRVRATKGK